MGAVEVRALDGISLDIEQGSFNVAMGPSGSGKSTLLYLLGGLDRPTRGVITVGGSNIAEMDENELAHYRRKTCGFIFQSFNLVPTMTALNNVSFPMRFAGIPKRQRDEKAYELLERVGLGDRAYHKPTELSGGQQQRVAVARALVNDPQLVFADEPTGNLDTSSGLSIMNLLVELYKSGRTVVMVTHDPRMQTFATNTIHMLDGQVVDEATYEAAMEFSLDEDIVG